MCPMGAVSKINLSMQHIGKVFFAFKTSISTLNMHFVWSNHLDLHLLFHLVEVLLVFGDPFSLNE